MSKKRTLFIVVLCGLGTILFDRVVDGQWPDHSALGWLILIGGLVVIAVGFMVIDSRIAARKREAVDDHADL